MDTFRLDIPYAPQEGARTLLLLIAGALVIDGAVGAVLGASIKPLAATTLGCAVYIWLLVKHPTYQYITALNIDKDGIWFLRDVRPGAASSKFAWHEINAVSARRASAGEENQGLQVTTTRFGAKGVPFLVTIGSESECLSALQVAQSFVGKHAQSAA